MGGVGGTGTEIVTRNKKNELGDGARMAKVDESGCLMARASGWILAGETGKGRVVQWLPRSWAGCD